MLVDCGATSLTALKAQGLDPGAVDAVAVTHLHGDHFGGLPFLILDGQFSHRTRPLRVAGTPGIRTPLRVAGTPGIRTRLAEAMEVLFPGSGQVRRRFAVEVTELRPDGTPASIGAAVVRGWEVVHACGAPPLALRVEVGGRSFGYSGDTQWTTALTEAAGGADLFAAEAYTFDRPVRYHLDYQTLRAHLGEDLFAAEAYTFDRPVRYHLDYQTLRAHLGELDARRIVLTHMSADMLARQADAELPAAYDGMTVEL